MGFRRIAALWRKHLFEMTELPYQFTKSQMVRYHANDYDILLRSIGYVGFTEGRNGSNIVCVKVA